MTGQIEKIREYITKNYNYKDGAITYVWSMMDEQNDIFSDGELRGKCLALYEVAMIVEMNVTEPEAEIFDFY